eukprot:3129564-Prymnesium_polylepis.1
MSPDLSARDAGTDHGAGAGNGTLGRTGGAHRDCDVGGGGHVRCRSGRSSPPRRRSTARHR